LNIDNEKYELNGKENDWLRKRVKEIVTLPKIILPSNAKSRDELTDKVLSSIDRLNQIFWDEMENEYLKSFELLQSVNTIGGQKKEQAILERTSDVSNSVYTGDSITDREALRRVRKEGGLSVSVNGDTHAVNEAEIGCLMDNTILTSVIVDTFLNSRKDAVQDLVHNWSYHGLKKAKEDFLVNPELINTLISLYPKKLPEVVILTGENREEFGKRSSSFGKKMKKVNCHGKK
jgi:energy-converting hydrogenase A subunit R